MHLYYLAYMPWNVCSFVQSDLQSISLWVTLKTCYLKKTTLLNFDLRVSSEKKSFVSEQCSTSQCLWLRWFMSNIYDGFRKGIFILMSTSPLYTLRSCSSSDSKYLVEYLDGIGIFLCNSSFGHVSVYMRESDTYYNVLLLQGFWKINKY